jgi:hypothetical protein
VKIRAIENENYFFEVYLVDGNESKLIDVVYTLHEVEKICHKYSVPLSSMEIFFFRKGEKMLKRHGHFLQDGRYVWNWDE